MKPGTTSAACIALLRRDFRLIWRRRGDALNPVVFAIIVVALFPLALGPETQLLSRISAGTVLVAVLLAMLLSLDTLFRSDLEDGSLEQLVLSPHPLSLLLACKIFVHWLTTALPPGGIGDSSGTAITVDSFSVSGNASASRFATV